MVLARNDGELADPKEYNPTNGRRIRFHLQHYADSREANIETFHEIPEPSCRKPLHRPRFAFQRNRPTRRSGCFDVDFRILDFVENSAGNMFIFTPERNHANAPFPPLPMLPWYLGGLVTGNRLLWLHRTQAVPPVATPEPMIRQRLSPV